MNVVFLAQERRGFMEEDDEEAPEIFPGVSPAIRETLTAAVSIIGRAYVREVVVKEGGKKKRIPEYRLWIGPNSRFVTKDRSNAGLSRSIKDPNISTILETIVGGK
jgi:hypothetical protein